MSAAVKEPFLEEHWMLIVIVLGVLLTGVFALYDPIVPGETRTTHTDPKVMTEKPRVVVRTGGD